MIGWSISPKREMNIGQGITTASGVLHEIDLAAGNSELLSFMELKNRSGYPPDKNDVIVFFAKLFDYLVMNADLLLREICPVFVSATTFEVSGLAACLGLGVHPVAPSIKPVPALIFNAMCMKHEIKKLPHVPVELVERSEGFCTGVIRIAFALDGTWISSRCGRLAEDKLLLKAGEALDTWSLAADFMDLNSEYIDLKEQLGKLKRVPR
jgi:hypothetical protein